MIAPISITLPNGLRLEMFPRKQRREGFRIVDAAETEEELWRRFVAALKATNFEAIVRLYVSAVSEKATPPKPRRKEPPLLLEAKQVIEQ